MPTTSPPDGPEVYTGETLEEAMAAAVAAHGPDLVVEHARRVRSGVRGLLGRERYEVVVAASPAGARSASGDPVEAALAALLDDADAQEAGEPVRTVRPRPAAAAPRSAPAAEQVRPVRPAAPAPRSATPAPPRPRPRPVEEPPPAPPRARPAEAAPRRAAVPPVEQPPAGSRPRVPRVVLEGAVLPPAVRSTPPAPARTAKPATRKPRRPAPAHPDPSVAEHTTLAGPSWSRAALKRLGVPARVLSELPDRDPVDDLAWLVALTGAISACVPPPSSASARTPAVVDGHELAGAVAILDLCSRGAVPGTLTTGGRTVPATATELALLVRTHVVAG